MAGEELVLMGHNYVKTFILHGPLEKIDERLNEVIKEEESKGSELENLAMTAIPEVERFADTQQGYLYTLIFFKPNSGESPP